MKSLSTEIAKLSNTIPLIFDNEDDEEEENAPIDESSQNLYIKSELRSKTAPLLEDIDPTYSGRKVSRKSRGLLFSQDKEKESESEEDSEDDDDEEEDEEDYDDEDDIHKFQHSLQNNSTSNVEESSNESTDDEVKDKDNMISQFANIDVTNDIQKGKALKSQEEIWNKLCEMRIKLQKLLILANKLPQTDHWQIIKNKVGEEMSEISSKDADCMKVLLMNLLNIQSELYKHNKIEEQNTDDMEIPSDSDAEGEKESDREVDENSNTQSIKRKYKNEDYSEMLAKKFKSEKLHRNTVLQKWDEKVRLSSGRITQKSFNAFNNSAVKQIEQVLQDRNRLIKRTQLKRSVYRVLGKPEFSDSQDNKISTEPEISKQDMLLRDYDPQIFDDDDFYRQLLKDIIQSKSFGLDPSVIRKQMDLQTVRNKLKRKVDTKASKGRRLRYDIQPKLLNCMAFIQDTTISDEARESMIKCLFEKNVAV